MTADAARAAITEFERSLAAPLPKQASKALPVAELWQNEDGRTAVTDYGQWEGGGGRWHLVGPLYLAAPPAAPEGWSIEVDDVHVAIRNDATQCGQAFYPDRDPLIHAFLRALAAAPTPKGERG